MTETFRDAAEHARFELAVGDAIVFAAYRRIGDSLMIDHVEAPPRLRGTGAAGRLMGHVVARARTENRTIVPLCGYAAAWLRRHPPA